MIDRKWLIVKSMFVSCRLCSDPTMCQMLLFLYVRVFSIFDFEARTRKKCRLKQELVFFRAVVRWPVTSVLLAVFTRDTKWGPLVCRSISTRPKPKITLKTRGKKEKKRQVTRSTKSDASNSKWVPSVNVLKMYKFCIQRRPCAGFYVFFFILIIVKWVFGILVHKTNNYNNVMIINIYRGWFEYRAQHENCVKTNVFRVGPPRWTDWFEVIILVLNLKTRLQKSHWETGRPSSTSCRKVLLFKFFNSKSWKSVYHV